MTPHLFLTPHFAPPRLVSAFIGGDELLIKTPRSRALPSARQDADRGAPGMSPLAGPHAAPRSVSDEEEAP